MSVFRLVNAALAPPALAAQLRAASQALGVKGAKLQDQDFLASGFPTSARSPFAQVKLLFRLAANGQLEEGVRVGGRFEPVVDDTQTKKDLAHWGLLDSSGNLGRVGERILQEFSPIEIEGEAPQDEALSAFHLSFLKIVDAYSSEDRPRAWRTASQQAEAMAQWALEQWPHRSLTSYHIVLLDFLSSTPSTTAGPVPLQDWRREWTRVSTPEDWDAAGAELCQRGGQAQALGPLLSRYFAPDQKGGERSVQLTVDLFRFFAQGDDARPAPVIPSYAPTTIHLAQAVVSRRALVRIREKTEPERQKEAAGYACQLCGGFVMKKDGRQYVEAGHIVPFSNLDFDGIPGNYLVLCPNHHKAFDIGPVKIVIPPGIPDQFTVELLDAHGRLERFTVRPLPRQVEGGFWNHLRRRFPD